MIEDPEAAPIDEKLRATLRLLRKMTLTPAELGPDDVRAVLATGVTKQAVEEAMQVAFLFNVYDRMADAMGWDLPEESSGFYMSAAKMLLSRGYE